MRFWNFTLFHYWTHWPQVKQNVLSSIRNLVCELLYELLNHLRLRIWGNQGILEKFQILVEMQPSAQSPFQKFKLVSSRQKVRKYRYQSFSSSFQFYWICALFQIFCPGFIFFTFSIIARLFHVSKYQATQLR